MKSLRLRKWKSTLFVLPAFLLHFAVIAIPAFTMIYYALTDWNGLNQPNIIGFGNFARLFQDRNFYDALSHNIVYMLIFLIVPLVIALCVALPLIKLGRVQMFYRALFFLPYVIGAPIAGKLFTILYSPYYGIPSVLTSFGIEGMENFALLNNTNLALYAVAFVDNWHWWGFVMAIILSALHQVDPNLYEAADIEGINPIQKIWHITIPQIKPTLISYMMFDIMASFMTFDYIYVMTNGAPAGATEVLATYIYRNAMAGYDAAYGTTISLTVCLICIGIYFVYRFFQKKGAEKQI